MPPGVTSPIGPSFGSPKPSPSPTTTFGNPATFTAAANTQGGDYDKIMQSYADLMKQYGGANSTPNVTAPTIAPQTVDYEQSADVTGSLANLSNLAATGGYSSGDIVNLRERGISPTRSIYANAQQNVERSKALNGGYSPNYAAVQAKMARDESSKISDIDTNVNAGIAQNVAGNKIAVAAPYASAAGSANALRYAADSHNADIINQINEMNATNKLGVDTGNANRQMSTRFGILGGQADALAGMRSLYGTTPALTSLFGNQVIQAGQLGQGQQQINNRRTSEMLSA